MRALHVLDRVRERERELLHRRRSGLADVVAGDRDRIPARHLRGAEPEDLGDEREARLRRIDVRAARDVLLEDVVLNRAARASSRAMPRSSATTMYIASSVAAVALIVIDVDTRVERDAVEQHVHVLDRVDRDADAADFAERARRIGVDAHLRRQVERDARAPSAPRRADGGSARSSRRAVPKPAYWRIVHSRPRYIVGCTPRVYGNRPGSPRSRA